jgi:hypothetical protein
MLLISGLCIAEHESHLDTAAIGTLNTDGSKDHGIFQVNKCIHLQIYSRIYALWFEKTFWEQGLSSEVNKPSDIEPSMEREDSLSCSQETAIGIYPKPRQSTSQPYTLFV